MYREHFGLFTDPFTLSPNLKFIFMSRAHEETMAHLAYGIEQGEDFILITGEIGTGKTLALHNLISQLSKSLRVVFISVTQLNFRELLKLAVREAGMAVEPTADIADLLVAFKEFLVTERDQGRRVLLIIDEAQNLSVESLEGLRMLANLAQPGEQALQIVFSGQLRLGDTIDRPELIQLRQRIRVRYRLETLDRQELEAYVNHRLKVAGRSDPILSRKALDLVYEASGGVPRLVNHLVSKALLAAFVDGAATVEREHVDTSDLPVPQAERRTPPREVVPPPQTVTADSEVIEQALAPLDGADPAPPQPVATASGPRTEEPRSEQPKRGRRRVWNLIAALLLLAAAGYVAWDLTAGFTRLPWAGHSLPWTERQQTGATDDSATTGAFAAQTPANPATAHATDTVPAASDGETASAGHEAAEPAVAIDSITVAATDDQPVSPAGYCVHVASFARSVRADRFRDEFLARSLPSFVRETVIRDETWYRVYVGPYDSRAAAESVQRQIQTDASIKYSMIVELRHG